jgi:hypothetical protein
LKTTFFLSATNAAEKTAIVRIKLEFIKKCFCKKPKYVYASMPKTRNVETIKDGKRYVLIISILCNNLFFISQNILYSNNIR